MSFSDDEATIAQGPPDPGAGPSGFGGVALEHRDVAPDSRKSSPCSMTTKRGRACGRTVGVRDYGDGPRCPSHKPRSVAPAPLRAPVRSIKSPQDAMTLASWAAIAVAEGKLSASAGHAIVHAAKEFRLAFADAGTMERARVLLERMEKDADEFANLRRIVALARERGIELPN